MIGLGTNARSYTKGLHYSTDYAVSKPNISTIINSYVNKTKFDFESADYGIRLSEDDRKRRHLIKSLLKAEGLDCAHYQTLFTSEIFTDFPELQTLLDMNLAEKKNAILCLNEDGFAYSDLIGHWFISSDVRKKMDEYIQK